MRTILRRAVVLSSAVGLAFFCSCERHKPDELPTHNDHAQGADDGHGHGKDAHGHAQDGGHAASGHEGHAPGAANPAASPVGTPAQFFPAASPSPH